MSLEDAIRKLQAQAVKLEEAKEVNKTEFSDNEDKGFNNDIESGDKKSKKDGDARKDTDDNIDNEDETDAAAKKKPVKEAKEMGTIPSVATDNAKIKAKLSNGDKTVIKSKTEVQNESKIDLGALFDGVDLTEEFKEKATTIFEAAVSARVAQEVAIMEEELAQRAINESEELVEGLVDKVDGYLDFMVEQWIKDNNVALERGIKAEIFESFVTSMKEVFVEHNITLPDEDFDLVESTLEKTEMLESKLDEQVAQNIELNKVIKQYAKDALIKENCAGMTDLDAEKFAMLAEEIQFDDEETFVTKLNTIRENYVSKPVQKEAKQLTEDVTQGSNEPVNELNEEVKKVDPAMAQYLRAFNK